MRCVAPFTACAVALALLPACAGPAGPAGFEHARALAAESLEVGTDADGRWLEVEYHIRPEEVPAAVRQAMDALHPGGPYTGAEREWNDGVLYFELTRLSADGMEVEAMFLPDGRLHRQEVQVAADSVAEAARRAVAGHVPGGEVRKWERILDAHGALIEYHCKLEGGGMRYKVAVSADGHVRAAWRETPAELEIPL